MELTKVSENSTTITLGWTPPPGVGGYVLWAHGQAVSVATANNKDGSPRNQAKFSKTSPGPVFNVVATVLLANGSFAADVGTYPPPPSNVARSAPSSAVTA